MHTRTRRLPARRIASVMLFVWLFAVAASWVNACILQPQRAGDHPDRSRVVAPHGVSNDRHDRSARAAGSHEADQAQQACISFCDTEQHIATKAQPAKGDRSAEPSAGVAQVVAAWPVFVPRHAEIRWRPSASPPPAGPPVAIAFLRLTI